MHAAILDVQPGGSGEARISLTPGDRETTLPAGLVEDRARLARACDELQARSGGSAAYGASPEEDQATAEAELAWGALHAWDYEHVVGPLLPGLPAGPVLLAYPGAGPLSRFAVRPSLRVAHDLELIDADTLLRIASVALFRGPGLGRLWEHAQRGALPEVDPRRTAILIAPPPRHPLETALSGWSAKRARRTLAESTAVLQQIQRNRLLEQAVQRLAEDLGVRFLLDPSPGDLLDHLAPPGEGHTLFLVAHHDEEAGLHLGGTYLEPLLLKAAFLQRATSAPYENAYLGVCGAGDPDGLAGWFGAVGTPVVITQGTIAFYGRALASVKCALEVLADRGPRPMPQLVDEAWLRLTR